MSAHTIAGTVQVLEQIQRPDIQGARDILVYLPPGYDQSQARYPVLYMHDGQNLFDQATSFGDEWQVDETMEQLSRAGYPAIVVGLPNQGTARLAEYSPFPDAKYGGGQGQAYLAFLVETLKPQIDQTFRTLPDRLHTGMMGSSMGGLISLYALFRFPSVFGGAGVMSPSLWFGQGAVIDFISEARPPRARLYLDVGTHEGVATLRDVRRLARLLVRKGFKRDKRRERRAVSRAAQRLRYAEDPDGRHAEWDWARRLEGALEFLVR